MSRGLADVVEQRGELDLASKLFARALQAYEDIRSPKAEDLRQRMRDLGLKRSERD